MAHFTRRGWAWLGRRLAEPVYPYLFLLVVVGALVSTASWPMYSDPAFREGLLVEAHGMWLDILVLGVLLAILNRVGEKRKRTRAYLEEIADLSGLQDQAVAHRLAGIIRRLNALGARPESLTSCYVEGIYIDLRGVDLSGCVAVNCSFSEAMLQDADLSGANLTGAAMEGTKLMQANLRGCDLKASNCRGAWFQGADLRRACFHRAVLSGVTWDGADLDGADIRGGEGISVEHLARAKNLANCRMDDGVREGLVGHSYTEG